MEEPELFRLIVLGAGFSRPAGFPLAADLWEEILRRSKYLTGRAAKFHDDLNAYISYRRHCDDVKLTAEEIDFEEFMEYLDVEHILSLRGSDTWSDEGNEGTIVVKSLIGQILSERMNNLRDVPEVYLEFCRNLRPLDTIITFNYDTLLERALEEIGKPYRLFPDRYKSVNGLSAIGAEEKGEVIVLKVHGSIDWFDRSSYEYGVRVHQRLGAPLQDDIIFTNEDELGVEPIVDGPRLENDPLATLYRVKYVDKFYRNGLTFAATRRMLSPSRAKIMYANRIGDFWNGMRSAGALNFGVSIIGYSLPTQDHYAKQIMYSLVRTYQTVRWDKEVFGRRKTPLVLVDFFEHEETRKAYMERFRFVDWDKAVLHGSGFGADALNIVFGFDRAK